MSRGERIELILDDPRGARDIPYAAEAEGYSLIESVREEAVWRLTIEK